MKFLFYSNIPLDFLVFFVLDIFNNIIKILLFHINLRENIPEIKEVYKLAEFHEQKPMYERGIDLEIMKKSLIDNGFINIQPTFHWGGKLFNQLDLI